MVHPAIEYPDSCRIGLGYTRETLIPTTTPFLYLRHSCINVIPATTPFQRHSPFQRFSAKAGIQELCMAKQFFVYIMGGRPNGTPCVGATSNPVQRAGHKQGVVEGFTRKDG